MVAQMDDAVNGERVREVQQLSERVRQLERSIDALRAQLADTERTLDRVDVTTYQNGLKIEQGGTDLKFAIEEAANVQRITSARLDLLKESLNRRIMPLELADGDHRSMLAAHVRRLDELEGRLRSDTGYGVCSARK